MKWKMETRKIVLDFPIHHPVYQSIFATISLVSKLGGFSIAFPRGKRKSVVLFESKTNYFQYTMQDFDRRNVYVLHPPLVALDGWEALVRGIPNIIISEYSATGSYKDRIASAILSRFKNNPAIVHTKESRHFLEKCGFKNVFLIPPAEKKGRGKRKREYILFVGKLIETKNIDLLIKISKCFKNEKFIIVGKGPLSGKLSEETRHLANVKHVPIVEKRKDLFEYYSGAKLLIHPALKDPVGFVIIEALSTQTPVLASSKAGASSYLPREWVADPNDEQEWFSKIREMLDNQEKNVEMAEKIFEGEHLDLSDPFFESRAKEIYGAICARWPHLRGFDSRNLKSKEKSTK